DLALSIQETSALLRSFGVDLGDEGVAAVHRRTEGWAAGISLVAQAPQAAGDLDHALEHGQVFAYLAEQVFADQPAELQAFLLLTAIPERISPSLAAAISDRQDARHLLAEIRRRRLFLQPLGGPDEWYRYHALFRRFLIGRLELRGRAARERVERRTGEWWL